MSQVMIVSIVRFNNTDLPTNECFAINDDTTLEAVKKALTAHIIEHKEHIVGVHNEDDVDMDDEDVIEQKTERLMTYERILKETEHATSLRELSRHSRLNDGYDIDSGDEIYSYVNISTLKLNEI